VDHDTLGIRFGIRSALCLRQRPGCVLELHYRAVRRREDKSPPAAGSAYEFVHGDTWRTHLRGLKRPIALRLLAVNIATSFHSGSSARRSVRSVRRCFWNWRMVATGWIAAQAKKTSESTL